VREIREAVALVLVEDKAVVVDIGAVVGTNAPPDWAVRAQLGVGAAGPAGLPGHPSWAGGGSACHDRSDNISPSKLARGGGRKIMPPIA
jgi:hypothetical protein